MSPPPSALAFVLRNAAGDLLGFDVDVKAWKRMKAKPGDELELVTATRCYRAAVTADGDIKVAQPLRASVKQVRIRIAGGKP
jgi:allophanate hydrolase subunit 2